MGSSENIAAIYNSTTDENVTRIYLMGVGVIFVKDYLPDGTPCGRQPTKEEQEQYGR